MQRMKKGFTLVELMVVVLIVGILASVSVPMYRGSIDAAKWSEAKASCGTIYTAVKSYVAENEANGTVTPSLTDLGFNKRDLDGTYFKQANFNVSSVSINNNGQITFTVTVKGKKANKAPQGTLTYKVINNDVDSMDVG